MFYIHSGIRACRVLHYIGASKLDFSFTSASLNSVPPPPSPVCTRAVHRVCHAIAFNSAAAAGFGFSAAGGIR